MEDVIEEIERIFLDEAHRRLDEVEGILRSDFPPIGSRDLTTLQRHAHSLKGIAGSLGHFEIETLAADIWTRLDEDRRGVIAHDEAAAQVRAEFERVREEVRRLQAAQ